MTNTQCLINTAALTAHIKEHGQVPATANSISGIGGYFLKVEISGKLTVLSTYLSDKPRVFKRAESLLKEAKKMGLTAVLFPL